MSINDLLKMGPAGRTAVKIKTTGEEVLI